MIKKVYTKKSEKAIDFLVGFLAVPVGILSIYYFINPLTSALIVFVSIVLILGVIFSICLCFTRKFIRIGLLFAVIVIPVVLSLVVFGTCLSVLLPRVF